MTVAAFYDRLSPFYHLIFPAWEQSIERQAADLGSVLRERLGEGPHEILDVACGIGTQAIGLASLGHRVTGSDPSPAAIERARREAEARGLDIPLSVADMRRVGSHHPRQFDAVIACDNAVPHLLTDAEILQAFEECHKCVRPGGALLVSVRDYDREDRAGTQVKPYGVRTADGARYLVFQVWEFHGLVYDMAMYFVEDRGGDDCVTHVMRAPYYAIGTGKLVELMTEAGFTSVERLDGRYYQPLLVGTRR